MWVVLDLTEGLQGHTITCDNFFRSYALGSEQLKRKLTMVGTVRKSRPELPPALLTTRERELFSSLFVLTETHSLVSSCQKKRKNVLLMSTQHSDAEVIKMLKDKYEDDKPSKILDYNRAKGGVDNLDKMAAAYTCKRKIHHWPMAIFANILDVSALNAFVLWSQINPSWNRGKQFKRRLFLEDLGRALVLPLMLRRKNIPRTPVSLSLLIQSRSTSAADLPGPFAAPGPSARRGPYPMRKRCRYCFLKENKTSSVCAKCNAFTCKAHSIIICKMCMHN
ncbi:uncharacterized protein LOC131538063 [Onychostoma macrolepis]|uniref:uncharacterized protein LOC131538063 n=1 Tax=Onychostoma macrolepis TaxID=369639 RepID=UPI00272A7E3A|nr:uncharacterized protein LOC131538063 [Onychostoma macrolepis]